MGLFSDLLDAVVELPSDIVKGATETVTRIPEIGINVVKGVVDGVESGIDKVDKAIDKF